MAKKRMQVVVDEVITGPCPDCKAHSGLETSIEALCVKLDEKEKRLTEKIDEGAKINDLRFSTLKDAGTVFKEHLDSRLESMNHLAALVNAERIETAQKLLSLTNTFLTKDKFEDLHSTLQTKLGSKIELFTKDIGALQVALAAKKEGLRWIEYLVTISISFIVFVIAHVVFKV